MQCLRKNENVAALLSEELMRLERRKRFAKEKARNIESRKCKRKGTKKNWLLQKCCRIENESTSGWGLN